MITSIHGILEATGIDAATIRVGGFGIRVFASATTLNHLPETGSEVTLATHFHVREDAIALYGFTTEADRDCFVQLIGVSGVGPRVALAILSVMDALTFYQAIANEDQQKLGLAKGVGKKLAAHIVLELKGKLPSLAALGTPAGADGTGTGATAGAVYAEAMEALQGLGYSTSEAQSALTKVPQDHAMTLEELITFALRSFSRQ
jgi:Holliday junction DNA helicase, RuvA subunit